MVIRLGCQCDECRKKRGEFSQEEKDFHQWWRKERGNGVLPEKELPNLGKETQSILPKTEFQTRVRPLGGA